MDPQDTNPNVLKIKNLSEKLGLEFLDSIIENIPDMIFVKDAKELRFVRFNKAGEELLGFKKDELLGKNDYDFFPKEQADFFTSRDMAVLKNKVLVDILEEPIDTKYKGKRFLHTKKIPILDEKGEPAFLLGISDDITDRKKLQEEQKKIDELLEIDRMKTEFISIVAHQLRTPLSGMRWALDMVVNGQVGEISTDQKNMLSKVAQTNVHMITLVNNLLSADTINSGKYKYNFEQINFVDLCGEVLSVLDPLAKQSQVTLLHERKEFPLVLADPDQLLGAFQNLVENAIKYTRAGGSVTVDFSLSEDSKFLVTSVKDTGIGIPADQQGKIFEKLFRASNAVQKETSGSGLGLYITKAIINRHGGKIWFTSEEGKGTTFFFSLPLVEGGEIK